jgi:hypothetical protein
MKLITYNSMGNAKNSRERDFTPVTESTQVYKWKKVMMKKIWRKSWNYYIPKGKNGGYLRGMF